MGSITLAELKVEGIEGLQEILSFGLRQYPGEHAYATLQAVAQPERVKEPDLAGRWIQVWTGENTPLFCGRLQSLEEGEA